MFTKEELKIVIQLLNEPRNQTLQTAAILIALSNKVSGLINKLDAPEIEPEQEK